MNPVVHFEMPFDDRARLARFYEQAFGWQMQPLAKAMGDYVLATTTPSDSDGRPTGNGAINGGFFPKKPDFPAQVPSVVISVDDIRAAHGQGEGCRRRGARRADGDSSVGQYVSFMDSERNGQPAAAAGALIAARRFP
jgi:predicted enzyme related to lactoylglutathione lyase